MHKDKKQSINQVISELCKSVPGLDAALLLDGDGTPLARVFPEEIIRDKTVNEGLICAMTIKALKGTSWVIEKLGKGTLDILIAKGSEGVIFIREIDNISPEMVAPVRIVVLADTLIPIELALLHIEKVARRIVSLI
ncbi:MAG: roadblock/LC7 domain-containing protein [Candidatus Hodarchaeales archaeon]|jgi:predicted regulator of Ras-like GTPase activity (Roadblock/LC7/MglB family)